MHQPGAAAARPIAILVWILSICVFAFGIQHWLPAPASEHGPGVDRMIYFTMFASGGFLLVGHAALGYMLWRFSGDRQASVHRASVKSERRWALWPVVVMAVVAEGGVLVLGLPVWAKTFASEAPPDAMTIEVTTEQFGWNVRYAGPDGKFGRTDPHLMSTSNPLGMDPKDPAGKDDVVDLNIVRAIVDRPVKIRLRSKDVLHSFFLPNFRIKQDSVPGMTIEFWFVPTKAGEFELACAELCGMGHWEMRGLFRAMSVAEFDKWMKEQTSNG